MSLPPGSPKETELRGLLALRSRVQQALAEADDAHKLAGQLCTALCGWPGVVHASVWLPHPSGEPRLAAQQSPAGIDLDALRSQPALRDALTGLLAVASGEMAWLDPTEQAADPALAASLREHAVGMLLGLPIPSDGPGGPRASVCLMFGRARLFSEDELGTLADLAALAGVGLRMADISGESEQLLSRLTQLASTDALTGVANRRRGEELLELEIKRARRYRLPLALIALDIDHFRAINDRYGHPVGDLTLRTVADAIRSALRSSDMVGRSGGDQFQILAPHTSAIDALKIAEKLRLAIADTAIPGCDRVTVSLGVAQLGEQETGDALTRRVIAALARAKRAGRNCVELAMR